MYKVTILGTENSHALNFVQLINGGHPQRNGEPVSDFKVCGIYGETDEAKKASDVIKSQFSDVSVYESIDEALKYSDAIMVTARHGNDHLRFAEKFIEAGIPAFIDKPFTVTVEDAEKLIFLAKRKNVPLCGGSCCGFVEDTEILSDLWKRSSVKSGGEIYSPVSMKNDYGNFFFYSQHLVQIMCEIFGYYPESVSLTSNGKTADGYVKYSGFKVDIHYTEDYTYKASVSCDSQITERNIDINKDGYKREVDTFCDMVRTSKMHRTYDELASPVYILNAMQKSIDSGGCEIKCR